MLLWLLLTASPSLAETPEDGVRQALAEQVDLPGWQHRRAVAEARHAAGSEALRGERGLAEGFPTLSEGAWGSPSWVAGQLARLDAEGAARAGERVGPVPDLGRQTRKWEVAREAALTSEDTADSIERRFLLSLRAFHEAHPSLTDEGLAPFLAELDDRRALIEADWEEDGSGALALAHVDEERQLLVDLQRTAMQAAAVPGIEVGLERDIARLDDPDLAADAVTRLVLGWSLTGTDAADAWLTEQPLVVPTELDAVDISLGRIEARAGLTGPPAWLDREQRTSDALLAQREILVAALDDTPVLDAVNDDAEREAAEQALAEATGARELAVAEVVKATFDEVQVANRVRGEVEAEEQLFDDREADFRVLVSDLQAELASIQAMAPLDVRREPSAVEAWRESNGLVADLREVASVRHELNAADWATKRDAEISSAKALLEGDRGRIDEPSEQVVEALERREQTLEAEVFDVDRRVDRAETHSAEILTLLAEAKDARRALKEEVPRAVWIAEEKMVEEALTEVRLLVPNVWALTKHRLAELWIFPTLTGVLGMLRGLVGLGLVGLIWWALRSRSGLLVAAVVTRWASGPSRRERQRRLTELSRLIAPATPVVTALVDLVSVWVMIRLIGDRTPELAFACLVYGQIAAYRLVSGLYRLLVAPWSERRPAFTYLNDAAWKLGDKTARWLATWAIARQFVGEVLLDLLGVDALNELAMRAFALALVALVIRLLHLWEPELRKRIARAGNDNALRAWLTGAPANPALTGWLRALVSLVLLTLGGTWNFIQGQAGEKGTLGRLLNLFYRYRLGDKEESQDAEPEPLPDELLARLFDAKVEAAWHIERPQADEAFWASLRRWQRDGRQGSLALIADTGAGRSTWLGALTESVAGEGLGLLRCAMDHRLDSEAGVCLWLARSLGCSPCSTPDELIAELETRPPSVIVLDRAHYAFLRTVGGFDGLHALLDVIGHSSSRHFWVVVFHAPAWAYLSRLHRLVKVHLFRDVIELSGLNEAELTQLTRARTEAAGYTVDFGHLVRRGALSGDVEGELERATRAFYRVLGEASLGNPMVALQLWAESLSLGEEGTVAVRLGRAVRETREEGLSEVELFTLAALRMQEGLSAEELSRVNNMPAPTVRSSLQVLVGRGLIERGHMDDWQIAPRQLATVTRTLVQRNLMEWRG
ncbi:MAG: hypothetical protein GY913_06295 [Proteobacteria bacterium]|nr:hypothetical protein [Pseudomonadota bacterium]